MINGEPFTQDEIQTLNFAFDEAIRANDSIRKNIQSIIDKSLLLQGFLVSLISYTTNLIFQKQIHSDFQYLLVILVLNTFIIGYFLTGNFANIPDFHSGQNPSILFRLSGKGNEFLQIKAKETQEYILRIRKNKRLCYILSKRFSCAINIFVLSSFLSYFLFLCMFVWRLDCIAITWNNLISTRTNEFIYYVCCIAIPTSTCFGQAIGKSFIQIKKLFNRYIQNVSHLFPVSP
jgi:hypothetical protein